MVEAAYNKRMLSDRFPLRFNSAANAGVRQSMRPEF